MEEEKTMTIGIVHIFVLEGRKSILASWVLGGPGGEYHPDGEGESSSWSDVTIPSLQCDCLCDERLSWR